MKSAVAFLLPLIVNASPTINSWTINSNDAPVASSENSKVIPNSYIVVFKDHVDQMGASLHHNWVQDLHLGSENHRSELRKRSQIPFVDDVFEGLKHTYDIAGSLLGYSGHFDDDVIEQIRQHPDVSMSLYCMFF